MAIFGAMNTSALAMNAHSHTIGSIGTNIANVNTTSYKKVETLYQTMRNHVAPRYSFFAVNTVDVRRTNDQGSIVSSGRAMDAAINGQGFFVTNTQADGTGETRYTRAGTFTGESYTLDSSTNGSGALDQGTRLVTLNGDYVMGYKANDDGTFSSSLSSIDYANNAIDPGRSTSKIVMHGNLPSANGSTRTYQTSLPVVRTVTNSSGIPASDTKTVNLTFSPTSGTAGSWDLLTSGGNGVTSVTTNPTKLVFDGQGKLDTSATGTGTDTISMTVNYADGTSQSVQVNMADFTQYSGDTDITIRRMENNGMTAGTLQGTYFTKSGDLVGRFSNNTEKTLYKLPLATFVNPEKLEAIAGNSYRGSPEAGDPTLLSLKAGDTRAEVLGSSLEMSNVDLEDQFSKMIVTQRAYSSAATVFRTTDEMSQTARDLFG
ncbi:flagellar hook protein FlgE [Novispirillum itersonii]|uniref:Flagellar hook protein FlgE n=1 Tax=Novispirillum itersonii TaxID=189 RepID=A0A7W9ZCF9_NOVIT|nr:flagellar hook-basal body complex protein [Novispirillum itersonii]MBB6208866.1 flagellar hook protein FlgE [Novispirillum itersonii]